MKYAAVDPIIEMWVKDHSLTLYESYREADVRSVDLVDSKGRRYQIWLDPPTNEYIAVHAWDYKKRRKDWCAKIGDLRECLENALDAVEQWFSD